MPEAEMGARSESDMPVRPPCELKPFGMLICSGVMVGRTKHRHDLVALPQPNAAKLGVSPNETRLGELHRRDETQELLDGQVGALPVLCQPVAQLVIFQKLEHRSTDEM